MPLRSSRQFIRDLLWSALQLLCELKGDRRGKFAKGRLFRLLQRDRNIDSVARLNVFGNGIEDLSFEYMKQKLELPAIL